MRAPRADLVFRLVLTALAALWILLPPGRSEPASLRPHLAAEARP
jgi:hypothetical protein